MALGCKEYLWNTWQLHLSPSLLKQAWNLFYTQPTFQLNLFSSSIYTMLSAPWVNLRQAETSFPTSPGEGCDLWSLPRLWVASVPLHMILLQVSSSVSYLSYARGELECFWPPFSLFLCNDWPSVFKMLKEDIRLMASQEIRLDEAIRHHPFHSLF